VCERVQGVQRGAYVMRVRVNTKKETWRKGTVCVRARGRGHEISVNGESATTHRRVAMASKPQREEKKEATTATGGKEKK